MKQQDTLANLKRVLENCLAEAEVLFGTKISYEIERIVYGNTSPKLL